MGAHRHYPPVWVRMGEGGGDRPGKTRKVSAITNGNLFEYRSTSYFLRDTPDSSIRFSTGLRTDGDINGNRSGSWLDPTGVPAGTGGMRRKGYGGGSFDAVPSRHRIPLAGAP